MAAQRADGCGVRSPRISIEWPLYDLENKRIMIFDEFNIHPEKESQRKILDWERTYFLTKYFCM